MPGVNIYSIFKKYSEMIRQFRITQNHCTQIDVEIVPAESYSESVLNRLTKDLRLRLGTDMECNFIIIDKIKRVNNKIRVLNRNI